MADRCKPNAPTRNPEEQLDELQAFAATIILGAIASMPGPLRAAAARRLELAAAPPILSREPVDVPPFSRERGAAS